ncbi:MAG: hypothetical protein M3Y22_00305, partial [Pseudomonadota bacterium]|nr:hypothetical protein [Pseudomonadota bacterium]
HLDIRVIVRRVGLGAAPFAWEIHGSNTPVPRYVSPDRFRSMEAAYDAGQARLAEFLPSKPVKRKKAVPPQAPTITDEHDWQPYEGRSDEADQDIECDVYDAPALSHDSQTSSRSHAVDLEQTAA